MICRAGSSFLLKADISHFYPSLYTHAVGWAIDPKLRLKANWKNNKLLGKRIDQLLMDSDGKISQGIPIGNDVSFLLAELVLCQIDRLLGVNANHAFRWFDDYEFAFTTRTDAEITMRKLIDELASFRLRLNPLKTKILALPRPADDHWQHTLHDAARGHFRTARKMVKYFDVAFRLREREPESAILSYALGVLFQLVTPSPEVGRVAQSCVTQAILCEPGCAQKGFSLLSFWKLNGLCLDGELMARTVNQVVLKHRATGVSSDVAWALAFCLDHQISLSPQTAKVLSSCEDDCVGLQALHMFTKGLLSKGFSVTSISKLLKSSDLDREHWLLAYESARQGFLSGHSSAVKKHPLFSGMMAKRVSFYRANLPAYAAVIHPGGAPSWMIKNWIGELKGLAGTEAEKEWKDLVEIIGRDFKRLGEAERTQDETVAELLDVMEPSPEFEPSGDSYAG